jgi:ElaB/YqjD/DUF883 family membrane-anchored ribosome-binding protein
MDQDIPKQLLKDNVVDKAASVAAKAVDATKSAATSALDSVSDKVESMRSSLSPALDRAMSPLDSMLVYTREKPLTALACAVAIGAVLSAVLTPTRRSRR